MNGLKPFNPPVLYDTSPGLPLYWATCWGPQRDAGGGDVADLMGATQALTRGAGCNYVSGPNGPRLSCDGTATGVANGVPTGFPDGASPRTVITRINSSYTGSADRYFLSYGGGGGFFAFGIQNGLAIFTSGLNLFSSQPVADGIEHELAITTDGTNHQIYVDGAIDGEASFQLHTGTTLLQLGGFYGSKYANAPMPDRVGSCL